MRTSMKIKSIISVIDFYPLDIQGKLSWGHLHIFLNKIVGGGRLYQSTVNELLLIPGAFCLFAMHTILFILKVN